MNKQYEFIDLGIYNATLITPFCTEDVRGDVRKVYSREVFEKNGILFQQVEDLLITSKKNVIRGLHFQRIEGQAKLIRVIKGKIFAVILDIDVNSKTFGKWISLEIEDDKVIYVPKECAFGLLALKDTVISCQCDSKFIAEYSDGIIWNDQNIGINWPLEKIEGQPLLSEKDNHLQLLKEYRNRNYEK